MIRNFFLFSCLLATALQAASLLNKNFFLFGIENSAVNRTGYVSAGGKKAVLQLPDMTTFNYNLGFYKPLYRDRIALRVNGVMGDGKSEEMWHNRILSDLAYHDLRVTTSHSFMGLSPDVILYARARRSLFPYIFAGTGISNYTVSQQISISDTSALNGEGLNPGAPESMVCFHFNAGGGMIFLLTYYFGFYAEYKFKYWMPVTTHDASHIDAALEFTETHRCHILGGGAIFRF